MTKFAKIMLMLSLLLLPVAVVSTLKWHHERQESREKVRQKEEVQQKVEELRQEALRKEASNLAAGIGYSIQLGDCVEAYSFARQLLDKRTSLEAVFGSEGFWNLVVRIEKKMEKETKKGACSLPKPSLPPPPAEVNSLSPENIFPSELHFYRSEGGSFYFCDIIVL